MSVTGVAERWQGRGATTDERAVRTLKRQWRVTTSSDLDYEPAVVDGVVAFDATAALFAPHPAWPSAICRKLTATPDGGPRVWLVEAEYSSAPFAAAGDGSGSPTPSQQSQDTPADQRPVSVTVTRKEVTEPLEFDVTTGLPVVNSAGDKFDPTVEVFRSRHVVTWKFYRAPSALDWTNRADWLDSINRDGVTILGKTYAPFTLRCTDYAVELQWEKGAAGGLAPFFQLTVQAEYDPDTWKVSVLDTGRRKKVTILGLTVAVAIVDRQGQPVHEPVPLDATGQPLAPGGTYHQVTADGYEDFNWNGTGGTLTGAGGLLA